MYYTEILSTESIKAIYYLKVVKSYMWAQIYIFSSLLKYPPHVQRDTERNSVFLIYAKNSDNPEQAFIWK